MDKLDQEVVQENKEIVVIEDHADKLDHAENKDHMAAKGQKVIEVV
jgi:hypothetical protein